MTLLLRAMTTALRGLTRHALFSVALLVVLALLVCMFNAVLLGAFAARTAVQTVSAQIDLVVPFAEQVDRVRVALIMRELDERFPTIQTVQFISADEAFSGLLDEINTESPRLANWLDTHSSSSPLAASLVISADPRLHDSIRDYLATSNHATLLQTRTQNSDRLHAEASTQIIALDQLARQSSVITGMLFAGLATVIIVVLIRLIVFSRKNELAISLLVGATQRAVRLPFILEGITLAVLATAVGATLSFFVIGQLAHLPQSGVGSELLSRAAQNYTHEAWRIIGWEITIAVVVGWVAAIIATWRQTETR